MKSSHLLLNIIFMIATQSITASQQPDRNRYLTGMQMIDRGLDKMVQGAHTINVQLDDEVDPVQCCVKIIKGSTQCLCASSEVMTGALIETYNYNYIMTGIIAGYFTYKREKQKQN